MHWGNYTDLLMLLVSSVDRPLLKDIMMECSTSIHHKSYEIEKCWEEIGIQLEVDDEELQDIRRRCSPNKNVYSFNYTGAFKDTMRVWIKQDEPQPTWARFVEALERLKKFPQFVKHLRSKYCMWTTIDSN